MFVIRKKLSADDTLIAFTRYNDVSGTIQTTPDNGVTWIDNPCADTRTNIAYRLPPRTGLTAKCDAATGIVESVRKIVALFLTGVIAFQFVNGAITILLVIVGIGLFVKLLFQLFNALLVIGAIAVDAAFNPTIWYELKCIVKSRMSDNGLVTQAQFDAINARVSQTQSNVVSTVWGAIVATYGHVGMSNIGASYIAFPASDCDDCASDCDDWLAQYSQWNGVTIGSYGEFYADVIQGTARGFVSPIGWTWQNSLTLATNEQCPIDWVEVDMDSDGVARAIAIFDMSDNLLASANPAVGRRVTRLALSAHVGNLKIQTQATSTNNVFKATWVYSIRVRYL